MEPSLSPIRSLRGHTEVVQEVAFLKNRNKLEVISTSNDKTVRMWDVDTGEQENSFEGHGSETCGLAVSMDGRRIVTGAKDGKIIIWDADTKEIIRCLSHHTKSVNCIQFSPGETRLASVSSDSTLKIWDTETWELVLDIYDHQGGIGTVAYSPNGTKIASGSHGQTARIWNATTGKQQTQPLSHGAAVRSIVWSPDSRRLISACNDGQIYFWSAPTGAQLGSPLRAHLDKIHILAISPDGELIASASMDHTARLWSTSTHKQFGRVLQHASSVSTVAFSPDGQLVATGGRENTIFLWDISQESIIMTHAVSPPFVSPASNITSYIDQLSASSDSLSASSTSEELSNETEFATELVGSRDATSPSPSLHPRDHSHHEIPSPIRTSLAEPSGGVQVHPDTINSHDAAPSPSPSFPSQRTSRPHIAAASASTPALFSPLRSFWKRFRILNRSAASVDSSGQHIHSNRSVPTSQRPETPMEQFMGRVSASPSLTNHNSNSHDSLPLPPVLPSASSQNSLHPTLTGTSSFLVNSFSDTPEMPPETKEARDSRGPEYEESEDVDLLDKQQGCNDLQPSFVLDSRESISAATLQDLTEFITKSGDYPIARGGFGEIWKCIYHTDRGPIAVAVKSLLVYASDQLGETMGKKAKRIHREIRTCARLKHHNILSVYGYTYGFGLFIAIVSPWAENGNLTSYLEREDAHLTTVRRFQILRDIADGLHYLHTNNIIHGDLTGPNVLIHGNGTACLADFGLSLVYSEVMSISLASWTSTFHGNFRWLAPELLGEPDNELPIRPSKCSDVYSFGGIMLQVLTSRPPYYYLSEAAVIQRIGSGVKPLRSRYPALPDKYWHLIEECWSAVPQDRPLAERVVRVIGDEQDLLACS